MFTNECCRADFRCDSGIGQEEPRAIIAIAGDGLLEEKVEINRVSLVTNQQIVPSKPQFARLARPPLNCSKQFREFKISIHKEADDPWGITVFRNINAGDCLTISHISGVLASWNEDNPNTKVHPGDMIVAVNGAEGPTDVLRPILLNSNQLELILGRYLRSYVQFRKVGPVGIELSEITGDAAQISMIKEGCLKEHNAYAAVSELVYEGDRIVKVNGVTGSFEQLVAAIRLIKEGDKVELTVERDPPDTEVTTNLVIDSDIKHVTNDTSRNVKQSLSLGHALQKAQRAYLGDHNDNKGDAKPTLLPEDHQHLQRLLQKHNLVRKKVRDDGNCQFRALADQILGNEDGHREVRYNIVQQLKSDKTKFEDFVPGGWEDFLAGMQKTSGGMEIWGNHVTLHAAADAYDCEIYIFTDYLDNPIHVVRPSMTSGSPIYLCTQNEIHYDSIQEASEPSQSAQPALPGEPASQASEPAYDQTFIESDSSATILRLTSDKAPPSASAPVPQSTQGGMETDSVHACDVVNLGWPTSCSSCKVFLWGVRGQGNQCRSCQRILCAQCVSNLCTAKLPLTIVVGAKKVSCSPRGPGFNFVQASMLSDRGEPGDAYLTQPAFAADVILEPRLQLLEVDKATDQQKCGWVDGINDQLCHIAVGINGKGYSLNVDPETETILVKEDRSTNFFDKGDEEWNSYNWAPLQIEQLPEGPLATPDDLKRFALSFNGLLYKLTDRLPGILGPRSSQKYYGYNCQEFAEHLILFAYGVPNAKLGRFDNGSINKALFLFACGVEHAQRTLALTFGPPQIWNTSAVSDENALLALDALRHPGDEAKVMAAMQKDRGWLLRVAAESLKSNAEIIQSAFANGFKFPEHATEKMKRNEIIVRTAFATGFRFPRDATEDMRDNEIVVYEAVQSDGLALEHASENLRDHEKICFAAVTQNGHALQFVSEKLRSNEKIVLAAVKQNGHALQFASRTLKSNQKIVLAAGLGIESGFFSQMRMGSEQRRDCSRSCAL